MTQQLYVKKITHTYCSYRDFIKNELNEFLPFDNIVISVIYVIHHEWILQRGLSNGILGKYRCRREINFYGKFTQNRNKEKIVINESLWRLKPERNWYMH